MTTINDIIGTTESIGFEEYLNRYGNAVGHLVNEYIPHSENGEINRYLYDPIFGYSQNGGKRHRPLICYAACRIVGGDMDKASSAAAAIEHFHTAALIHDDIADAASLRRGELCLYRTEGLGSALNIGDLGLYLASGTVMNDEKLEGELKLRMLGELTNMTKHTIEGQALDIGWARDGRFDISIDDYLTMATHKTAHYSGAVPLALGAIAGGGNEVQIEALRSYGLATGLAFQIQDDLLNLIGSEESTKKDFRSDITEGKRTLMVVHALEHSPQKDRLIEILSAKEKNPEVLAEAVDIMEDAGSIEFASQYADNLIEKAKEDLCKVFDPSPARDLLISMADWFVDRLH